MACKSNDSDKDISDVNEGLIGPDGGELSELGLTISIPAGALTKETKVEIKKSKEDLSARDFFQKGSAIRLLPEGTILRLPAKISFTEYSGDGSPAVLFRQDELTVATLGQDAYINEFNLVARADAGSFTTKLVTPTLAPTPDSASKETPALDSVDFNFAVHEMSSLELVLTAYDVENQYSEALNGTLEGECAFQLDQIKGGSLSNNCARGSRTATITILDSILQFRTSPFLAPKLEHPIIVSVIAGSDELAYFLGFMRFKSGSCFGESCSGHGICDEGENGAQCLCEEGFGPDGLNCVCLPRCEGRECGPDSCGGRCDPGCESNASCDQQSGQCQNNDDSNDQGEDQGEEESTSSSTGSDEESTTSGTTSSSTSTSTSSSSSDTMSSDTSSDSESTSDESTSTGGETSDSSSSTSTGGTSGTESGTAW